MHVLLDIKALYEHLSPVDGVAYTEYGYEVSHDGRYYDLRGPHSGLLIASHGETCSAERMPDGSVDCSTLGESFILSKEEFEIAATET